MVNRLPTADLEASFTIKTEDAAKEFSKSMDELAAALEQVVTPRTKARRSGAFVESRKSAKANLRSLSKIGKDMMKGINEASEAALYSALEEIKNDSVSMTPKDTGLLRETAFVATQTVRGGAKGKVGYNITSGPLPAGVKTGAHYAAFVHETPQNYNVGDWKFLERAVNNAAADLPSMIAKKGEFTKLINDVGRTRFRVR